MSAYHRALEATRKAYCVGNLKVNKRLTNRARRIFGKLEARLEAWDDSTHPGGLAGEVDDMMQWDDFEREAEDMLDAWRLAQEAAVYRGAAKGEDGVWR